MSTVNIQLPDGSSRDIAQGSTGLDLAKSISNSLAKQSIGLEINGKLSDLTTTLSDGDTVKIITTKDPLSYEFLRHSTAHILACAVQSLYPSAKIAIGPTIENGFYYDFFIPDKTLSVDDLAGIEAKMQEIIDQELEIKQYAVNDPQKQINSFISEGEKFKAELLEKYKNENPTQYGFFDKDDRLTWSDLCRGPHITNTKQVKAFKLLTVSGAYWHGDENLDSLQRVYGTSWWSAKELDNYLTQLAEAEKRDHRKLSKQHQYFSTHEEAGPGLIFWHPKLAFLRTRVEEFWRQVHEKAGYEIIYTPHIAKAELWQRSGHTEHYSDNMFSLKPIDENEYILKPMNCPFHVLVYDSMPHSYRELPIRLAEMGTVYRYERSGALHGLARVRGFTQDDAHVFCTVDQLVEEVCDIISLVNTIYSRFDLEYTAELSTRPPDKIGDEDIWDKSEEALQTALGQSGLQYEVNPGDGAFYGPKIDFKLKDALGREWQGATVQVDFNLPERFNLKYIDSDNSTKRPVMLHRAIFGSLERFTALLIENYAGAFPFWLSKVQAQILPIADRHHEYAKSIKKQLNIRTNIDSRSEKVNAKIRDAQLDQIPYMLIVGDKEMETNTISIRHRRSGDIGSMAIGDFIKYLQENESI